MFHNFKYNFFIIYLFDVREKKITKSNNNQIWVKNVMSHLISNVLKLWLLSIITVQYNTKKNAIPMPINLVYSYYTKNTAEYALDKIF